jgi:hypothetical protein
MVMLVFFLIAQENTESSEPQTKCKKEKREKLLLPEKGNWAIGADLIPILRTLGTVFWGSKEPIGFQGTPYQTLSDYPTPNASIVLKSMICKNVALRANLSLGFLSFTMASDSIWDDAAFLIDNESTDKVVDKYTENSNMVSVALGVEYRVGKKRVVGIFGGDILFGYYGGSTKMNYGNLMTENNKMPTTYWDSYYYTPHYAYSRILTQKNEGAFALGLQATAGVEVFVAPKIALGGQVNLSYVFLRETRITIKYEGFNEDTAMVESRTDMKSQPKWYHSFSTNNVGASLYMFFYF